MRATRGFIVALLLFTQALFASATWASHAIPVSTTFTAFGPLTISAPQGTIPCTATLVLTTDILGNLHVTQMTLTGTSGLCEVISAEQLPWSIGLTFSNGTIQAAALEAQPFFNCNGSTFVSFSGSHLFMNGSWGVCSVSGNLAISPTLTISP